MQNFTVYRLTHTRHLVGSPRSEAEIRCFISSAVAMEKPSPGKVQPCLRLWVPRKLVEEEELFSGCAGAQQRGGFTSFGKKCTKQRLLACPVFVHGFVWRKSQKVTRPNVNSGFLQGVGLGGSQREL